MTVGAQKSVASFPGKPPLFVCVGFVQQGGRGRESILNMGFLTYGLRQETLLPSWLHAEKEVFYFFKGEAVKKINRGQKTRE